MTAITTNAATTTLTTQDILDVTPRNGDLEILVGDTTLHVVGADGAKNAIFVDPNKDVCTDETFEISLNDFLSLEKIYDGYYRLIPRGDKVIDLSPSGKVVSRCSQSEVDDGDDYQVDDDSLEIPF